MGEAPLRVRRFVGRLRAEVLPTPFLEFLRKWVPLSILIGVAVGLMAVVFQLLLSLLLFVFDPGRLPWYLVFPLPALGGLLVGLIIPRLAPEAAGQGMDEVIRAYHFEGGVVRSPVAPVKILVSALTIGSGGSAGPEGPIGEVGAGTASLLGRVLKLRRADMRTLVLAGAAAGFGAIFKAPLGGALFALEVPYRNDLEHSAAIPSLISAVTGYLVFVIFFGTRPIFGVLPPSPFYDLPDLLLYLALGLGAGLVAVLFATAFHRTSDFFSRLPLPFAARTTLGGLACGLLGVLTPSVLGLGYQVDDSLLRGDFRAVVFAGQAVGPGALLPLALAALILIKIVATSFTIGSGGSGGVLTPSVVMGGSLGALLALLIHYPAPAILVVVGMGAVLAAATKSPIASAVMLTEMSGGFSVLIPLILATVVSYSISGSHTLYRSQLTSKAPPLDVAALGKARVADVMTRRVVTLEPAMTVEQAFARAAPERHYSYPVVTEEGRVLGVVYHRNLEEAKVRLPKAPVADILQTHFEVIREDRPALEALETMGAHQITRLLVVDGQGKLVGILTRLDLLRAMEGHEPP